MKDLILLKQGETILKGLNRGRFEDKLTSIVARRLRPYGKYNIFVRQSIIYAEPRSEECDIDGAVEALKKVFGIVSISRCAACEKDPDAIYRTAKTYLADEFAAASSFKVEAKRADKTFPMTSIELSQYVGGLLSEDYPDVAVDVHNPSLTVHLEVRERAAYVHGAPVPGAGGMPIGCNGKVVSMLSGGIDSPVSTWMAAKRGVEIIPVHFFSFPYTSELAKEKVITLAHILSAWCGRMDVQVVPFTHIQEEIRDNCPENLSTIIMRRFMMRIADRIATENGCNGIVTGESLGQVASQTLEAMSVTGMCTDLTVIRPLICLDKSEIVIRAREIGTFETSILPYEDCCTVFTPKHPKTRPHIEDILEAEKALDVEGLVDEAIHGIERIKAVR